MKHIIIRRRFERIPFVFCNIMLNMQESVSAEKHKLNRRMATEFLHNDIIIKGL